MKHAGVVSVVAAGLLGGLLSSSALASDALVQASDLSLTEKPKMLDVATPDESDWHLATRFGMWFLALNGTVNVRNHEIHADADFNELFDNMNFGFMPGLELSNDKWVISLNGVFSQLEAGKSFNGVTPGGVPISGGADVVVDMDIVDLGVGYNVFDCKIGGMDFDAGPIIGIRYTYLSVELQPNRFNSVSDSVDFWDPYVGAMARLKLTNSLTWRNSASIGGFDVGCDITWAAQTMIDWEFAKSWELNVGYRALYQDFHQNSFKWDETLHGPWLGISHWWS